MSSESVAAQAQVREALATYQRRVGRLGAVRRSIRWVNTTVVLAGLVFWLSGHPWIGVPIMVIGFVAFMSFVLSYGWQVRWLRERCVRQLPPEVQDVVRERMSADDA